MQSISLPRYYVFFVNPHNCKCIMGECIARFSVAPKNLVFLFCCVWMWIQAIRDGVIEATLDHENGYMQSKVSKTLIKISPKASHKRSMNQHLGLYLEFFSWGQMSNVWESNSSSGENASLPPLTTSMCVLISFCILYCVHVCVCVCHSRKTQTSTVPRNLRRPSTREFSSA